MLAKEPNLSTYFNTSIVDVITEGNKVVELVVLSEMEQMEIQAKVIIDSSGDAQRCSQSRCSF